MRDPNMLYDDSDQEEFHEAIAILAETVHWDLERYEAIRMLLGYFDDADSPTAKSSRIDDPIPAKRLSRTFTC